ncbi:succinyl-diaminopimelate desuccinylase [Raineyella fluvialis]|uniref:Succinyl-diaminopimelate desuccinylase n=1 Tax=Raineyella fluvialis TaxID=2662261 RepID=A0A5Q2FEC5_9ACTN|nr:succinyl-diaminopimelate desuccinylase [Raineyella fluvialis]QGF24157.1 succinyl-diaminopimelate desuccinylase [Raineyella fluvialis]
MALDLRADVVDLLGSIVDIESVSGNERHLADEVESALREYPHLEVVRLGNNVLARTGLGRAERVVVAGHLDTVPLADNLPSEIRTVDGEERLYGRGTCDMKAGVAVALSLAAELSAPSRDVTWIFYDNEEVEAARNGLNTVERERPDLMEADFAVLGEPSGARVEGGCQGTMRFTLTTTGVAAHSARAWRGVNAIHAAADVLERLAAYEPRKVVVDGLEYIEGLNAVRIHGGVAGNVIPDRCTIEINFRFAPDRTPEEAERYVRDVFEGYPIEVTDLAPGARPGLDLPIAQEFLRAVGSEPAAKYGWTDVARFSARGVPAVNYGPGDPLKAHQDDEYCAVASVRTVRAALAQWLGGGPAGARTSGDE